jgi:indoleacetamide hydrolase
VTGRGTIEAWRQRPDEDGSRAVAAAAAAADSHGAFLAIASRGPARRISGALAGVPFAVKDNIDVAGFARTVGSAVFADHRATTDAGAVLPLHRAGAWCVGKANLHELAFGVTSDNAAFGPVRHPEDRERSAGGSSGGSAVAVALGWSRSHSARTPTAP